MSYWRAPEREELFIPPSEASKGSNVGFLEGFSRAWDYGNLVESQFGVARDLIEQEQEMFQRLRDAGETPPRSAFIRDDLTYSNVFKSPADEAAEIIQKKNNRAYYNRFGKRDMELAKLKARYPQLGIKTYAEMYQDTLTRFQRMQADREREETWGGAIGGFVGSVVSGVDPRVNPLGTLTLPVGGFGKTVLGRIATESAAQGFVQGLEEVTGVRANKRLLGLEPSVSDSLLNVGLAAAGGGLLQGTGEAVVAGGRALGRRWFKNLPNDPAPPLPDVPPAREQGQTVTTQSRAYDPLRGSPDTGERTIFIDAEIDRRIDQAVRDTVGGGRAMYRAAREDYKHVAQNLEKWDGPAPWEIQPPSATRQFSRPGAPDIPRLRTTNPTETVDEIARRIDPDTFRTYDRLATEKKMFRQWIDEAAVPRNDTVRQVMADIDAKIANETRKLANANKRKAKVYEDRIRALTEERNNVAAEMLATDTTQMAAYRQSLMKIDENMRDLAPAVSRAYSRARTKWAAYDEQRAAIERMMQTGDSAIDLSWMQPGPRDAFDNIADEWGKPVEITLRVPELSLAPRKAGEAAADTVKRVNEQMTKDMEKALDGFQSAIPRLLKTEGDDAVLDIDGTGELKVKLSQEIEWTDDLGDTRKITVREMLEELQNDENALQAMLTCSVAKTSSSA